MKKLIKFLKPPQKWSFIVVITMGIFFGLLSYLMYLSKVTSYLSDSPETCVNCHIMAPQYATWQHSSHREVANCNDCHVPHDNVFRKYFFKAKDGLRHATIFTLRKEPQVIFIKEEGMHVVQQNCIRCHNDLINDSKITKITNEYHDYRSNKNCWECHRETPHGRVNSLSSTPWARVPVPKSPIPEWLKNY